MKAALRCVLTVALLGCSNTTGGVQDVVATDPVEMEEVVFDVAEDFADAAPDRRDATEADRRDATADEVPTPDADAPAADALDADVATDGPTEEASTPPDADCPRDPPTGPPAGVGQSCGAGRAPAEHCREVAFCGGAYRMGSTEAWDVFIPDSDGRNQQMRTCDVHEAVARGGYVDAYEVTVARYRAWVNAGFPHPRAGERFFGGLQWMSQFDLALVVPNRSTAADRVPGVMSTDAMCTWSATPGVNDDLPINCVPAMAAVAFCWWESKHLITEIGWEYLATNRGTTPTPFGAIPAADAVCSRGDVGGYTGQCARNPLPMRIGTHPDGATRDPAGIHDLWGGMQEWVIGLRSPYAEWAPPPDPPFCTRNAPRSVDGAFEVTGGFLSGGELMQRGPAWLQSATEFAYFYHAASRAGRPGQPIFMEGGPSSVRTGFRCARWLPEPR